MKLKVDKDIPIHKRSVYPELGLGESIFLPCKKEDSKKIRWVLYSTYRRRTGKYTVRQVKGGIRTWRIK